MRAEPPGKGGTVAELGEFGLIRRGRARPKEHLATLRHHEHEVLSWLEARQPELAEIVRRRHAGLLRLASAGLREFERLHLRVVEGILETW